MKTTMEASKMNLVERVRYQYHWLSQRTYGGRWFIHTDAGKRVPGSFATRVDAMMAVGRRLAGEAVPAAVEDEPRTVPVRNVPMAQLVFEKEAA